MLFIDAFGTVSQSNYHQILNDSEFPFENMFMRKWLWPNCNIISRCLSGGVEEKHEIFQLWVETYFREYLGTLYACVFDTGMTVQTDVLLPLFPSTVTGNT